MSEIQLSPDPNPLLIVEDEIPSQTANDNNDDNESDGELFDFSAIDTTETKRNSLQIVEEKDLMMDESGDLNNNSNVHRLSLQVESGDENSLVMTDEAVNRTIIRIRSNGSSFDYGESDERVVDTPNEAINHEVAGNTRRESENYPDDGQVIVDLLGQINDIVGCTNPFHVFRVEVILVAVLWTSLLLSLFMLSKMSSHVEMIH